MKSLFVDGDWSDGQDSQVFRVTNPATGDLIDEVSDAQAADAVQAIEAAERALPRWADRTAYERSEILLRGWQLMNDNAESLAQTMTREQGKSLRAARIEVKYAADFLLWYAEEAKRIQGQTELSTVDDHAQTWSGAGCRLHRRAQTSRRHTDERYRDFPVTPAGRRARWCDQSCDDVTARPGRRGFHGTSRCCQTDVHRLD